MEVASTLQLLQEPGGSGQDYSGGLKASQSAPLRTGLAELCRTPCPWKAPQDHLLIPCPCRGSSLSILAPTRCFLSVITPLPQTFGEPCTFSGSQTGSGLRSGSPRHRHLPCVLNLNPPAAPELPETPVCGLWVGRQPLSPPGAPPRLRQPPPLTWPAGLAPGQSSRTGARTDSTRRSST